MQKNKTKLYCYEFKIDSNLDTKKDEQLIKCLSAWKNLILQRFWTIQKIPEKKNLSWYFAWISRVGAESHNLTIYRLYVIIKLKEKCRKSLNENFVYLEDRNFLQIQAFKAPNSHFEKFNLHNSLEPYLKHTKFRAKQKLLKTNIIKRYFEIQEGIYFWKCDNLIDYNSSYTRIDNFTKLINFNNPGIYWIYYYPEQKNIKGFVEWLRKTKPSSILTHTIECILVYQKNADFTTRYRLRERYSDLSELKEFL